MNNFEEHIRRAIEEGQFENLPGEGKPLNLEENPFEDPEWSMAYRVLRDNGFTLPWIETRREIETGLEEARIALRRSWDLREKTLARGTNVNRVGVEWSRAIELFRERIDQINKRIIYYNLQVPSERFQCFRIDVERELELTMTPASDTLPEGNG